MTNEKVKMIRAMETVIRNLNDESFMNSWLMCGVPDGDITEDTTDEEIDMNYDDKDLSDFMNLFARIMKRATKGENQNGVFYCNGVIS